MIGAFEPLIPRDLRLEVSERLDATGKILTPIDEAGRARGGASPARHGCRGDRHPFPAFYIDPVHEDRAAAIVEEMWPEGYVTVGHRMTSEFREYERGVTAAVNASVQPVLQRYLSRLQEGLAARGYRRDFLVMQGNGGTVSSRDATRAAVQTVMSGPASGVIASAFTRWKRASPTSSPTTWAAPRPTWR